MFNIGDEVEIINDDEYSITKKGSWGVVKSVGEFTVFVDFKYTPSGGSDSYMIYKKHLKLRKNLPQEEKVCIKIRSMYERQRKQGCLS